MQDEKVWVSDETYKAKFSKVKPIFSLTQAVTEKCAEEMCWGKGFQMESKKKKARKTLCFHTR